MNLEVGIKGGRRDVCVPLLLPENSTRDHELSLVLGSEVVFSWLCIHLDTGRAPASGFMVFLGGCILNVNGEYWG